MDLLRGVLCYFIFYIILKIVKSQKLLKMNEQSKLSPTCLQNYQKKKLNNEFFPDPLQYWNLTDGLDISWSHATNSREKLADALKSSVMMLEADIMIGAVDGKSDVPVMGHPPNGAHPQLPDIDISTEEWLDEALKSDKGIKLDFKDIKAVEPTLIFLKKITDKKSKNVPLFLNSDIIAGPGYGQGEPLNGRLFVETCSQYFPAATLSIGWTTGAFAFLPNTYYDWSMANEMGEIVVSICQPVTFPVRAILVRKSWQEISGLMSLSEHFTLTVWSPENDNVQVEDLLWLRKQLDKKRVFYDLPAWLDRLLKEDIADSDNTN